MCTHAANTCSTVRATAATAVRHNRVDMEFHLRRDTKNNYRIRERDPSPCISAPVLGDLVPFLTAVYRKGSNPMMNLFALLYE
ncbi:unnamed protein product [Periconia digitata]|uniref:Uncharacterized protein n=1 Tax=Periconia digitata TaxID=1303443 RepID=A0A9W4XV81_9PLEO|nr:unnamed protein product [Periconia digitata]